MMSIVPVAVSEASIVSIVGNHLLLGDAVTVGVLSFTICHLDQLVDMLAAEWGLAIKGSYRRSHLSEDHHVVFRHLKISDF